MPGSGGEVRTYFFIRMLAEFGDVTLVSLGGPGGERKVNGDISHGCHRVIEPPDRWRDAKQSTQPKSRLGSWLRSLSVLLMPWRGNWREFYRYCIQYLPSNDAGVQESSLGKRCLKFFLRMQFRIGARMGWMPSHSVFVYSDQFDTLEDEAQTTLADSQFDLIWYEHTIAYPFVARLIDLIPVDLRPKLVCNAHNIEWKLHERMSEVATVSWEAEFNTLQSGLLKSLELKQFEQCDLVFTCSKDDAILGRQMVSDTLFAVIGNGVDTSYFRSVEEESRSSKPTLLFTGTFGYGPNLDGLKYFVEDIFPLIKQAMPDVEFVFAGYEAQRAFDELDIKDPQIRCVCSPPDIRPCFHKAWVFVVPLRAGSGTRLKILEAMSMHCPVVSTRIGAEGIAGENGVHFQLADSPQDFADATVRLLGNRYLRQQMQIEGAKLVGRVYDWAGLCDKAASELQTLVIGEYHG
jgi:glycosyltransferase involved in cell wall biosynthesis